MCVVLCVFTKKIYDGVPVMFPIPCACSEPSQHFLLYVFPSSHKQALLVPVGDVLLGVFHFLFIII